MHLCCLSSVKKCFMQWQTLLYHLCKCKHWSIFVQNISNEQFLRESKSGHKVINSIFALRHNSKVFPQMYVSITTLSFISMQWSLRFWIAADLQVNYEYLISVVYSFGKQQIRMLPEKSPFKFVPKNHFLLNKWLNI